MYTHTHTHTNTHTHNVLLVTVPQKHKAALKESAKKVARSARSAISGSGKQSEETEDTEAPTETEAEAAVLPALKIADFGLKIIDFGEGNTPEKAAGFIAGTPGAHCSLLTLLAYFAGYLLTTRVTRFSSTKVYYSVPWLY